ncbi:hypothetical protein O6H91_10G021100 [Diphasiastrum complanatum]|uniref:Uncharacterized protein n=1 Tax=Diphasiastrum complanatum TaxID=34168 RepID=A0ACC2CEX6_DIPCM|nr:hypothetical protein O6H91_10G021100 [Diphasiastrum complanatum]
MYMLKPFQFKEEAPRIHGSSFHVDFCKSLLDPPQHTKNGDKWWGERVTVVAVTNISILHPGMKTTLELKLTQKTQPLHMGTLPVEVWQGYFLEEAQEWSPQCRKTSLVLIGPHALWLFGVYMFVFEKPV